MEEMFSTFLTLLLAVGLIGFFVMYSTQKRLEKQVEQLLAEKRSNITVDHDQIVWLADRIDKINGTTNDDELAELPSLKLVSDENLTLLEGYEELQENHKALQKRLSKIETDFYAGEILDNLARQQAEGEDTDGSS